MHVIITENRYNQEGYIKSWSSYGFVRVREREEERIQDHVQLD